MHSPITISLCSHCLQAASALLTSPLLKVGIIGEKLGQMDWKVVANM